jgi:hypothetical protein
LVSSISKAWPNNSIVSNGFLLNRTMSTLPLPSQTLAWLNHAADAGQRDAQALLHLIARADAQDQWFAKFTDSYSRTIAALCRRLASLERGANDLPAPAAQVDDSPIANALIVAETALADVAEGEPGAHRLSDTLQWIETRCTEALADIRPVMKEHGIQTSEWPPAAPAPAAPTPRPTALVKVVGRELPRLPDGRVDEARTRFAIRKVAAWLDTRGQHACSALLREEIER